MGANNSSSSDTKQDGTVDSSTSRALEVVQAGGVWPKKAPEVRSTSNIVDESDTLSCAQQ